eukprot:NODE_4426_length_471_cov_117.428910_g3779_i2.p1 GENE.NODE_4426_length_471_cov_117.428910_g3779_i2~~NODE_4426_length_471_cov_117.428910_g3779_i2.p1  ORF type:complete len:137 (+),score=25.47 NODE_4426_length_471_cov_117.428910_g3779_i2:46-411(+)
MNERRHTGATCDCFSHMIQVVQRRLENTQAKLKVYGSHKSDNSISHLALAFTCSPFDSHDFPLCISDCSLVSGIPTDLVLPLPSVKILLPGLPEFFSKLLRIGLGLSDFRYPVLLCFFNQC